jgi:catechol 2,3-dioxygenase-like lactoylglutathione lyase family enzyme
VSLRGLVHHIDLSVSDLEASRAFYDHVLGYLGYARSQEYPDGTDWDWQGEGPFHSVGIVRSKGENASRAPDRFAPGLHHLAWAADDPADVDGLHALLVSIGATVLDAPAHYPQYGRDYHAVFFADPDGLKLELACGRTEPT